MSTRLIRNLYAITLVIFILYLMLLLAGCVSIKYNSEPGKESLKVATLFKSLDGLNSERDADGFSIIIDKTYSHDPTKAIAALLETYKGLYGMGLRYEPDVVPPLLPKRTKADAQTLINTRAYCKAYPVMCQGDTQ